jgi:uncharacterized protein YegL
VRRVGRLGRYWLDIYQEAKIMATFSQQQFYNANEPHMALVFLVDTSLSMRLPSHNPRITNLNQNLNRFRDEASWDKQTREILEVAIIEFNSICRVVQEFTPVQNMKDVKLVADGRTKIVPAIEHAIDIVEERSRFYRRTGTEPYKPWIILITDGAPDDDASFIAQRIRQLEAQGKLSFYSLGVEGYNEGILTMLSGEKVMALDGVDFYDFFDWVNKSMRSISRRSPGEGFKEVKPEGKLRFTNA